ncbi:MAG: hypothetical protein JXR21_02915 [Candidatus Marinimicrobia bacterium]|nr:hypothetical protein [Candidatus Neomarinimicrobiota bacterium]
MKQRSGILAVLITGVAVLAAGQTNRAPVSALPEPLAVAHELNEGVFCGWTYGSYSAGKKHLDCTTFVSAVLDTLLSRRGIPYTRDMRRDVLISHPDMTRNVVKEGPDPEDLRYGGIAYAVEKYGFGTGIADMSQVKPGDLIQYWVQRKNGTWFGHASLIESIRYDKEDGTYKAKIFGCHKSSDGIAVSDFELKLSGDDRMVYIGRMTQDR